MLTYISFSFIPCFVCMSKSFVSNFWGAYQGKALLAGGLSPSSPPLINASAVDGRFFLTSTSKKAQNAVHVRKKRPSTAPRKRPGGGLEKTTTQKVSGQVS